jgi:hypothetical protein
VERKFYKFFAQPIIKLIDGKKIFKMGFIHVLNHKLYFFDGNFKFSKAFNFKKACRKI